MYTDYQIVASSVESTFREILLGYFARGYVPIGGVSLSSRDIWIQAVGLRVHPTREMLEKLKSEGVEPVEAPGNSYGAWTPNQEQRLCELIAQGKPTVEIATIMGRSVGSISSRITKLVQRGALKIKD